MSTDDQKKTTTFKSIWFTGRHDCLQVLSLGFEFQPRHSCAEFSFFPLCLHTLPKKKKSIHVNSIEDSELSRMGEKRECQLLFLSEVSTETASALWQFLFSPPQKMCLNTRKWKTYAPASFPKSSWIDFGSASKFCFVTSGPGPAALTNGNLISAVYQDILQTNIRPPVGSLKLKWSPLMQHAYKPKTSCSPWRSGSSQVTVSTLANEMMLRYVLMTQPIVTKYDRIPTILSRRIG